MLIEVNMYSDFACPWCYVGKWRLDQALAELQNEKKTLQIEIHFHPYMIDTQTQQHGEPYLEYNQRRWGGDGWTNSLRESAKENDIQFASWETWPNTLNAHRLMEFAPTNSRSQLKNAILISCYEKGENISHIDVLSEIATNLHIDGANDYLLSNKGVKEVHRKDMHAKKQLKIDSVPFFQFSCEGNSTYSSGATSTADMLKKMKQLF